MGDSSVSELINVSQFINNWIFQPESPLVNIKSSLSTRDQIASIMGISQEMVEELENVRSPDALDDAESQNMTKDQKLIFCSENNSLASVKCQKAELAQREKHKSYENKRIRSMRYRTDKSPQLQRALREKEREDFLRTRTQMENIIEEPEALLTVRLYKNFTANTFPTCMCAFHALGSTSLLELRDAIKCPTDDIIPEDLSHHPDAKMTPLKDVYKGAFFYLEGRFFDDDRFPSASNLSKAIVDWANQPSVTVGPFVSRSMAGVCMRDLTIKLGQPYAYVHQGNCEHLLVFSDLRMLHADDSHSRNSYPLQIYQVPYLKFKCRSCAMYHARWLVRGSPHNPEDPVFLCDTCFRSFHYKSDGSKMGDFKAYAIQRNT